MREQTAGAKLPERPEYLLGSWNALCMEGVAEAGGRARRVGLGQREQPVLRAQRPDMTDVLAKGSC